MRRLSPMQRGYLLGLRRARAKMRAEVDAKIDELEATTDQMNAEMRAARAELGRLKTLNSTIKAERDPKAAWLN